MQLDGTWTGYYEDTQYEDSRFPLRVEFSTRSDRLSGTMIDERIEFSHTVQEALKGLAANSPHLRSWVEFAGAFPDAVAITHMPTHSVCLGKVRGFKVRFTKTYEGPQIVTWSASNLAPTSETMPLEPIQYSGVLSEDGREISGTWIIKGSSLLGLFGLSLASGAFLLRRDPL